MQNPVTFFLPCIPPKATSQQKGIMMIGGKPRHFKKSHVKQAENTLTSLLAGHRPAEAFVGPVFLRVLWVYPWRKSESRKNRETGFRICDTRPDCSNVLKMLEDCMTSLNFWNDDSQVQPEILKGWGDHPGIGIHIHPMHPLMLPMRYDIFKKHYLNQQ